MRRWACSGRCGQFLICLLGLFPLVNMSVADGISTKEHELKQLRGKINHLETELDGSKQRQNKLMAQLAQAEKKIGKTARQLRVLSASRQQQQQRLKGLQVERKKQSTALDHNRQALAQQLRSAYIMGRQERLKILLNQQDPAVVSRMLVYYDYFNTARTHQMALISRQLRLLGETEQALNEEQQRLQQTLAQVEDEKLQMELDQARRSKLLAVLAKEIDVKGDALKGYKQNEQQLKNILQQLQEELLAMPLETEKHQPFKLLRGKLQWPTKGRLAASFGTRKAGNLKWDGVVIAAPEGQEVKAIHHGRVAFADWLRGFGLLLIIDHGNGYMSLYGHNQSLFKEAGEWVEPGEVVALVGSSGGASNSGVYFGIRYQGRPVNPKRWCRRVRGKRIGMESQNIDFSTEWVTNRLENVFLAVTSGYGRT